MCIIGNIPELGSWKKVDQVKLKWNHGHVWESEPILVSSPVFTYKYTIFKDNNFINWE